MKGIFNTVLVSLLFAFSLSAQALPTATSLQFGIAEKMVTTPGSTVASVNLAVAVNFSNACVALYSNVFSHADGNEISVFTTGNEMACTANFDPVLKWTVVAEDLAIGSSVVVNGTAIPSLAPAEAAICTKDLCSDGSPRDSYTCACPNGLIK